MFLALLNTWCTDGHKGSAQGLCVTLLARFDDKSKPTRNQVVDQRLADHIRTESGSDRPIIQLNTSARFGQQSQAKFSCTLGRSLPLAVPILAGHLRFFDVCIVPYLHNGNGEMSTVVPTKINEYLAAEKAVVSTNLPTVCEFNDEHQILLTSVATPQAFLESITAQLLDADDPVLRKRRRKVAATADWGLRLEEMCELIDRKLSLRNG